eukprot:TRINITY_DN63396_c0_g1_i1.p1 TRINITY_DN63396_c0_g1~~TRINITY_DN63396_c0_g1_i1.p1  ORF type:complete len:287 (+),score=77.17 TRINITY_DN63396_c0_g1_i1:34-894(+)
MSLRPEDQERLPPMKSSEDVMEGQRLDDVRQYRKYLVDTSTVKCLVKMFQHAAKTEMRLPNPKLAQQFLAGYTEGNPDADEIRQLARENSTLKEYNAMLESQVQELEQQVAREQRMCLARKIWKLLLAGLPDGQTDISLDDLYVRLCGKEVEQSTNRVLVDLLRPERYMDTDFSATRLSQEAFCSVIADKPVTNEQGILLTWLEEVLQPKMESAEFPSDGVFQTDLMDAIVESGLLPHDLFLLADAVKLEPGLIMLLECMADGPPAPPAPSVEEDAPEGDEDVPED